MSVLFYLGHPAHFHLFRNTIHHLNRRGVETTVCIKSKDVLELLLKGSGIPYINIAASFDRSSPFRNFGRRLLNLSSVIRQTKPDLLLGSAAELTVLGRMHRLPSFVFFEDDFEEVSKFARIAGPLATYLVCPECCSAWKWAHKKISYKSYHELAYLHPNHFRPDAQKVKHLFDPGRKNFILRFAELNAYHDKGKKGINQRMAQRLIELLSPHGNIFITAERKLEPAFEKYRIAISPLDIHHALAFADMYIGDSQTMTAEAAVLGTPALRYNDFVGRLSYLEELEHKYQLTLGFKTHEGDRLLLEAEKLLHTPGLKARWQQARAAMLEDCIDLAAFINKLVDEKLPVV